jgi:UDP-N-acetylmuramoylalanine--D-glutamate ligase
LKISELEGKRVAIWGYGREGRAALAALRWRLPRQSITVFCNVDEAAALRAMEDPNLVVETTVDGKCWRLRGRDQVAGHQPVHLAGVDAALLGTRSSAAPGCGSPSTPIERTDLRHRHQGQEHRHALIAHLLRAAGRRTALAGNIGLPLLELLDVDPPPQYWAIELSSYQAREAIAPEVAVVLNFFPSTSTGTAPNSATSTTSLRWSPRASRAWPCSMPRIRSWRRIRGRRNSGSSGSTTSDGWHLRDNELWHGHQRVMDARGLPLPGRHNRMNLCAALAAWRRWGSTPKPSRSTRTRSGRCRTGCNRWARATASSSSTIRSARRRTPASPRSIATRAGTIAILVGGYDRGVDWGVFAERMLADPPHAVITMGQNGPRIHERSSRSRSTSISPWSRRPRWRMPADRPRDPGERGHDPVVAGRAELPALQPTTWSAAGTSPRWPVSTPRPSARFPARGRVAGRPWAGRRGLAARRCGSILVATFQEGEPAMKRTTALLATIALALCATAASAAPRTQKVSWTDGGKTFDGTIVWDDANPTPRPGLVMVPNWWGATDAAVGKARTLAGKDFVILVVDMYGRGTRPKNPDEAGKLSGAVLGDPAACVRASTRRSRPSARSPARCRSTRSTSARSASASAARWRWSWRAAAPTSQASRPSTATCRPGSRRRRACSRPRCW